MNQHVSHWERPEERPRRALTPPKEDESYLFSSRMQRMFVQTDAGGVVRGPSCSQQVGQQMGGNTG